MFYWFHLFVHFISRMAQTVTSTVTLYTFLEPLSRFYIYETPSFWYSEDENTDVN